MSRLRGNRRPRRRPVDARGFAEAGVQAGLWQELKTLPYLCGFIVLIAELFEFEFEDLMLSLNALPCFTVCLVERDLESDAVNRARQVFRAFDQQISKGFNKRLFATAAGLLNTIRRAKFRLFSGSKRTIAKQTLFSFRLGFASALGYARSLANNHCLNHCNVLPYPLVVLQFDIANHTVLQYNSQVKSNRKAVVGEG